MSIRQLALLSLAAFVSGASPAARLELASPPAVETAPTPLGIGMASVTVAAGVRLQFLASPESLVPVAEARIVENEQPLSFALDPQSASWLQPEMLWLDYSLMVFRVLAEADGALQVVVSDSGRTLWLRRQPEVIYQPWAEFLMRGITALDRLDPETNPIRMQADASASAVPHTGRDCFSVTEVRGVWARIETSELCTGASSNVARVSDGWIRWTDGERLLIDYSLTC